MADAVNKGSARVVEFELWVAFGKDEGKLEVLPYRLSKYPMLAVFFPLVENAAETVPCNS